MVLSMASTSVFLGWTAAAPCLTRTLQDQQAGLAQAPIKLLLFVLGPSVHWILCVPSKSDVCISPSPMGLLQLNPGGLTKPNALGAHLPVPEAWVGEPDMGLRTLTPVGEPLQYNPPNLWVIHPGVTCDYNILSIHLSYSLSLWFLLCAFSCRRPFFWWVLSLSLMVVLLIVVILVCLQGEWRWAQGLYCYCCGHFSYSIFWVVESSHWSNIRLSEGLERGAWALGSEQTLSQTHDFGQVASIYTSI